MIVLIVFSLLFILLSVLILTFINCIFIPALKNQNVDVSEPLFSVNEKSASGETVYDLCKPTDYKAVINCSDSKNANQKMFNYCGPVDCNFFVHDFDTEENIYNNCIGFGNCKKVCSQRAIEILDGKAAVNELCNGCGKCINVCPKKLISLVPAAEAKVILYTTKIKNNPLERCKVSIFNNRFNFYSKCCKIFRR